MSGWLAQAVTQNVGLKLTALVGSIGLFALVHGTAGDQTTLSVDVVTLLPEPTSERMLVSELPTEIRLTLRGSRSVLNAIRRDGLQPVQIDLREYDGHYYIIPAEDFELPVGAEVVQVAPAAVSLSWVDRAAETLRVRPVVEGVVAEGFVLSRLLADPSEAGVTGAANEVQRLDELRTEVIDVTDLTAGNHERRVALQGLPDHVRYGDASSVRVTVVVVEEEIERTLEALEVDIGGEAAAAARPRVANVQIRGPRSAVEAIDASSVVPFVELPDEFSDERGGPRVTLPLQVRGVEDGLEVEVEPAEVVVVPQG